MSDDKLEIDIIELVTLRYVILALVAGVAITVAAAVILARQSGDHDAADE